MAEILGALMVIGAALFAVAEIRILRSQRADTSAVELTRMAFQSKEFLDSQRMVLSLEEGATAAELRDCGDAMVRAAFVTGSTFETIGFMVHRRIIDFDVATGLLGGACGAGWRRLENHMLQLCIDMGFDSAWEWFQWFAERIEESAPVEHDVGAHISQAAWRP